MRHRAAQQLYYMLLNMDSSGSLALLMMPVIIVILPSVGWSVYCSGGGGGGGGRGQAAEMEACDFHRSSQYLDFVHFSVIFPFSFSFLRRPHIFPGSSKLKQVTVNASPVRSLED